MAEANIPEGESQDQRRLTKEQQKCKDFLDLPGSNLRQEWIDFILADLDLCEFLSRAVKKVRGYYRIDKYRNHGMIPSKENQILAALRYCAPADVRVVILGNDPVPDSSLATGLAYSFPPWKTESKMHTAKGKSAVEVHNALRKAGIEPGESLCHEHWAIRGVLLLNVCLTIDPENQRVGNQGNPHSLFWDSFIIRFLQRVVEMQDNAAVGRDRSPKFVLCWGQQAINFGERLEEPEDQSWEVLSNYGNHDLQRPTLDNNDVIIYLGNHPASRNISSKSFPYLVQAANQFKAIEKKYPGLFTIQDEYAAIYHQTILHNQTALRYHCKALSHHQLATACHLNFDTGAQNQDTATRDQNSARNQDRNATEYNKKVAEQHKKAITFHREAKDFHEKATVFHEEALNQHASIGGTNQHIIMKYHQHAAKYHPNETKYHQETATTISPQTTLTHKPEALDRLLATTCHLIIDNSYQRGNTNQAADNNQNDIRYHRNAANYNDNASEHHQRATDFNKIAEMFHKEAAKFHQDASESNPNVVSYPKVREYHLHAADYHQNEAQYHQEAAGYHQHINIYYQNAARYHRNVAIYHNKGDPAISDDNDAAEQ